jgi:hypothetical protein
MNLKFNKPELNVTIDREKQSLGISDIAQTQLSLSGQRFGYFMKKENNTKSLDSLINKIVQNRWT